MDFFRCRIITRVYFAQKKFSSSCRTRYEQLVGVERFELSLDCSHTLLKRARIPVPPRARARIIHILLFDTKAIWVYTIYTSFLLKNLKQSS